MKRILKVTVVGIAIVLGLLAIVRVMMDNNYIKV